MPIMNICNIWLLLAYQDWLRMWAFWLHPGGGWQQEVIKMNIRLSSWQLSTLSHGEFSWKHSREGLDTDANGSVSLKLADMRLDAMRELLRRKSSPAVG